MIKSQNSRGAFTLIELLVVVAIIALLISILLPALQEAREQGKVTRCLGNFKNLTTAAVQYFLEHNDNFPAMVSNIGNTYAVCPWAFGGATASDRWRTGFAGVPANIYYLPVQTRPFNKYLLGADPEPDLVINGVISKRSEVPQLRCPSDTFSSANRSTADPNPDPVASYIDVGTSYHYNLTALFGSSYNNIAFNSSAGIPYWPEFFRRLTRDVLARHSSTFTMFLEDPMNYNVLALQPGFGYHRKFNKHVTGYLDGHAAYTVADTRGYCGPGWTAINPSWVYKIGLNEAPKPAPIAYAVSNGGPTRERKNCDPPR